MKPWGEDDSEIVARVFLDCKSWFTPNEKCKGKLEHESWKKFPLRYSYMGTDLNKVDRDKWLKNIEALFCKTHAGEFFCDAVSTSTSTRPTVATQKTQPPVVNPPVDPQLPPVVIPTPQVPPTTVAPSFLAANLPLLLIAGGIGFCCCLVVIGGLFFMMSQKKKEIPPNGSQMKSRASSSMSRGGSSMTSTTSRVKKPKKGKKKRKKGKKSEASRQKTVSKSVSVKPADEED